jgi:nitrogen regulatory protein PII
MANLFKSLGGLFSPKKPAPLTTVQTENSVHDEFVSLSLLFIIADWDKVSIIADIFEHNSPGLATVHKAQGTAPSSALSVLGLGDTEKALYLCLLRSAETRPLIQAVRQNLGARNYGSGIAFTVPVAGIAAPFYTLLMGAYNEIDKTKKEIPVMENAQLVIKNHVIIGLLNQGYSEEFMKCARDAGARGGTVFAARGLTSEKLRQFMGVSIQSEKEIIIMLTDKDHSVPIMQSVSTTFGIESEAEGAIFSLPVDQVMSLNLI